MSRIILIAIVLTISLNSINTYGQGCSDAGMCTIASFKPSNSNSDSSTNNQFTIGLYYGKADHSITVWGNYIEYQRQLTQQLGFGAKLTTLSQHGNGINAFGISDLFLSGNYKFIDLLKFTLGLKIPLISKSFISSKKTLPMDYQSSLGTLDLLVGIGFEIKNVQFGFALQQPLNQNKNEFIAENQSINSILRTFQTTNKYKRNGDLLCRLSYKIKLFKNLHLTPGVLPIYHLSNDHFTDTSGVEREIIGSQGLTLNGNLYLDYQLNSKHSIQLNAGIPFIVRDTRPDGLTRSFIANLEYRLRF